MVRSKWIWLFMLKLTKPQIKVVNISNTRSHGEKKRSVTNVIFLLPSVWLIRKRSRSPHTPMIRALSGPLHIQPSRPLLHSQVAFRDKRWALAANAGISTGSVHVLGLNAAHGPVRKMKTLASSSWRNSSPLLCHSIFSSCVRALWENWLLNSLAGFQVCVRFIVCECVCQWLMPHRAKE